MKAHAAGTWKAVLRDPGMGRTTLAIAPSNQDTIYALAASIVQGDYLDGLHGVFRSTDGGATWKARVRNTSSRKLDTLLLSNPIIAYLQECFDSEGAFFNQGWYDNVIAVDPKDPNRVWAGGVDLFRSDDGGKTWGVASYWWAQFDDGTFAPSYSHADQHAIVFHPHYNGTTNKTMFVGNDGGIFKTLNARAATARTTAGVCDPYAGAFVLAGPEQRLRGDPVLLRRCRIPTAPPTSAARRTTARSAATTRPARTTGRRSSAATAATWPSIRPTPTLSMPIDHRPRPGKSTDGGVNLQLKVDGIAESPRQLPLHHALRDGPVEPAAAVDRRLAALAARTTGPRTGARRATSWRASTSRS